MKIYIQKNILLDALQLIVNVSPKTTSEPIINNVLLETEHLGDDQYILVKATNYENTFLGRFEVQIEEEGKICVNTNKLFSIAKEFRGEQIMVHSTPQNWVFLTSNSSKVKLPGVDPEQFPAIQFQDYERKITIPGDFLKSAIDRTFFAIGENESRKSLMGLNLEIIEDTVIQWVGADAFRISQYQTQCDSPLGFQGNLIIPKKSLNEIKRIIDYADGTIDISFDHNIFQVESSKIKFKTSLIEAEYPNLKNLLSNLGPYRVVVDKQEMINAVRILSTVTEGDINSVMKMTVQPGKVLLESQKLEFGEGNDEITCEYDGQEMSIGLNIRFFLDSLQVFDNSSDDQVAIHISNPEAPIVILCNEWENFKTVLMPVRIQW